MVLETVNPALAQFAADVRAGLDRTGQKELPSKYLYDPVGSALFEAISVTAEYGLTRADERLLRTYASDLATMLPHPLVACELGSGSGKKTRYILAALPKNDIVSYYPIEISRAALAACERELGDIDGVRVTGVQREYIDGLCEVAKQRERGVHLLVLFLGSSIGNFDVGSDCHFLRRIRETLNIGDSLLLGADLMKPLSRLIPAYDDPAGVTAAFNLNILVRINRELDADFNLRQFEHLARFNEESHSVEMHLVSKRAQVVSIPGAELSVRFRPGETIWTESSHKYSTSELKNLASESGFQCEAQWIDQEWQFAENLFIAV
jgi:L-histidine N-alpha-methyltransferase